MNKKTITRLDRKFWWILPCALLLTACGGGGGSSSTPAPTTTVQPAAVTPAPSIPAASTPATPGPSPTEASFIPGRFESVFNFDGMCINPSILESAGTFIDENNWLRSFSNETYLWYDEITDVDPSTIPDPLDYFDLMKTFALTPSGNAQDRFHSAIPTVEFERFLEAGVTAGYGATFVITSGSPPRQLLVSFTEPNTPASEVNLNRGARLLEVDGIDLVNTTNSAEIDRLNAGLFPSNLNEVHSFLIQDLGSTTTRTINMTTAEITSSPVQAVQAIETPSGPVGYVLFNDHIATSESALIDAINQLEDLAVNDLVLDLRYNSGGFLDIANELAFMIAGPSAQGQIFEELQFNDKHTAFDPITGQPLIPDLFRTVTDGVFSAPAGISLPSLNLPRVFILTSSNTCSASESIINGLRGIDIEVIQIGSTTCGKPYGFYGISNCGTTYLTIQFRGINAKKFGDYTDGFSPFEPGSQVSGTPVNGCSVADDFTHALGDPEEANLAAALSYRQTGSCPVAPSSARLLRVSDELSAINGSVMKPDWRRSRVATPKTR